MVWICKQNGMIYDAEKRKKFGGYEPENLTYNLDVEESYKQNGFLSNWTTRDD